MALLAHQLAWLLTSVAVLIGLNLVAGKAGVWSVGHLAFYGIGAYAMGWALESFGGAPLSVLLGLVLASVAAGGLAFAVARTALRLRQDFFVIFSLALLEFVRNIAISWKGPDGFHRLPALVFPWANESSDWTVLVLMLAPFTAVVALFSFRAERGPVDRVYALVRRSEEAALVLGRSPLALKRSAFVVSAMITALAASLYTCFTTTTEPAQLRTSQALLLFAALIMGGLNSTIGAVLGALLLVVVPRVLETLIFSGPTASYYAAQGELIVFGLILIALIHRHPGGLAGRIEVKPYA